MTGESIDYTIPVQAHSELLKRRQSQLVTQMSSQSDLTAGTWRALLDAVRDRIHWTPHERFELELERFAGMRNSVATFGQRPDDVMRIGYDNIDWHRYLDTVYSLVAEPLPFERDWTDGPIENRFEHLFGEGFGMSKAIGQALGRAGIGDPGKDEITRAAAALLDMVIFQAEDVASTVNEPHGLIIRDIVDSLYQRPTLDFDVFTNFLTYLGEFGAYCTARLLRNREAMIDDVAERLSTSARKEA